MIKRALVPLRLSQTMASTGSLAREVLILSHCHLLYLGLFVRSRPLVHLRAVKNAGMQPRPGQPRPLAFASP